MKTSVSLCLTTFCIVLLGKNIIQDKARCLMSSQTSDPDNLQLGILKMLLDIIWNHFLVILEESQMIGILKRIELRLVSHFFERKCSRF